MRKGIVDDGYGRIASKVIAQQGDSLAGEVDLSKQIKEFRQGISDAGLYYAPQVAESALIQNSASPSETDRWVMLEGVEKQGTNYIAESNMDAIMKELEAGAEPGDVAYAEGGEVAVRVFTPDGSLTAAGKILQDVMAALSSYPVLDDSDVSQREYDATLENFESEGYGVVSEDAPADWPKQVFGWLWDNAQNEVWGSDPDEDGGYWASKELIREAAQELGFAYEEEEEEDEFPEEPDPLAEGFATGPNPVDPRQTSLPFKGGRRRAQHGVQEPLPLHTNESPELPPGFEGFSEEEIHEQRPAWQKALMDDLGKSPKKRGQAAPQLPTDEEELNPEELEEVSPQREKFNWNDYIWGPFRKQKPARRQRAQMSIQDDAIVRMVTQEDARLVKYRGGLALVPVDGYAYPVDAAGAELALAHGAEDWTQPQERMKAGGREVLVEIYKGVSDKGLERIAQRYQAQSDPGVGFGGPSPSEEELEEAGMSELEKLAGMIGAKVETWMEERGAAQALEVEYDNGYGATVVCTPYSYGGREGLLELHVEVGGKAVYDTPITGDVEGWLTAEKAAELLKQIEALPRRTAQRYQAQAGGADSEILDAMARAVFVSRWANEWDYLFEDYDRKFLQEAGAEAGIEVPNFQGAELMDIAPPTEPEAYQVAQKMYDAIEQQNGIDLSTFIPPGEGEDFDRDGFGHYLAMQAMGTGVRWSDSHEDHGLKIPYMEGYVTVDEVERLKSFIEENYEQVMPPVWR